MALVGMVVFIASYSIGIGPIAWLLIGEIIPLRARGNAAGLSTAFNLFIAFVLTSSFSSMLVSCNLVISYLHVMENVFFFA